MARFRFAPWLLEWLLARSEFSFDWDEANAAKSVQKHGVSCREAEEVFAGQRVVPLGEQYDPSCSEARYAVLGETRGAKLLFLVFTLREGRVRVISVRPMNKRERDFYASLREE